MDKLVALRSEQAATTENLRNVSYQSLLAPFYYKAGDFLSNYIQLNTDELGTVKPFQEEPEDDSDEEEEEEDGDTANGQEETVNQPPVV